MPRREREFAPAKVNLTLHVTGRRPDGYHLLDSLVVFPAVGDRLEAVEVERGRIVEETRQEMKRQIELLQAEIRQARSKPRVPSSA